MEEQLSVVSSQSSVASSQLPVASCQYPPCRQDRATRVGHLHARSSKRDCKSLFRSTLTASCRESILCMGPVKVFKTGNLRIGITTMQSILCGQSIHTKYFIGGGGG